MEKVKSSGAAEKVSDKFPVISRKKKERWTGYKRVLLLSVIVVGPLMPVRKVIVDDVIDVWLWVGRTELVITHFVAKYVEFMDLSPTDD